VPARKKTTDPAAPKKAPAKKPAAKKTATSTAVSKAAPRQQPTAAPTGGRGGYDLVIIESAGKVKAISKYLGRGFRVMASFGHVRDLATGKDKTVKEEVSGIQIGNGWKMRYLVDAGSKSKNAKGRGKRRSQQQILDELAEAARGANRIFLASDPDREGESIAWHIADQLNLDPDRTFRIRFNEITEKAIRKAMDDVGQIDMDRVKSQEARRAMDRVVGFPLSNLLGRKVAQGLSAGRVQSVVVKLIVDREAEIEAFKQEEYWKLTALLAPQNSGIKWAVKPELAKIFAKKGPAAGDQGPEEDQKKPKGQANGEEELEDTEAASFEADGEGAPEQAEQPKAKSGGDSKRVPPAPKGTFLAELARWNGADPKLDSEAAIDAVVAALRTAPFVVTKVEQ
jgi:DNA topoisomerase-1